MRSTRAAGLSCSRPAPRRDPGRSRSPSAGPQSYDVNALPERCRGREALRRIPDPPRSARHLSKGASDRGGVLFAVLDTERRWERSMSVKLQNVGGLEFAVADLSLAEY